MKLKKIISLGVAALATLAAPLAGAFTYTNGDVLLIFRTGSGLNNVEFNLGNISQFLNHPNGYTATITNWSPGVVTTYYPLNTGDAQFLVIATDATNTSWVSDSQPLIEVTEFTYTKWYGGILTPIESIGSGAVSASGIYTLAPANTNYVVFPLPNGRFSYDGITGSPVAAGIPRLGGTSLNFNVTGVLPATLLFYQIQSTNITPKPAGKLIGSFTLTTDGTLTFQAGPVLDAAQITSITPTVSNGGTSIVGVGFNTKPAVKYELLYSPQLNVPRSAWAILPHPLAGDGTAQSLYDSLATNAVGFYSVESY